MRNVVIRPGDGASNVLVTTVLVQQLLGVASLPIRSRSGPMAVDDSIIIDWHEDGPATLSGPCARVPSPEYYQMITTHAHAALTVRGIKGADEFIALSSMAQLVPYENKRKWKIHSNRTVDSDAFYRNYSIARNDKDEENGDNRELESKELETTTTTGIQGYSSC